MSFTRRIVFDFMRRRRILLGLLGGLYLFCGFTLAVDSGPSGWKLAWFLAYAFAPSMGALPYWYDAARGWHRVVQLLAHGSGGPARISWFICVGIPTLGLVLLSLPAALFTVSDPHLFHTSVLLPTVGVSFASASLFYFGFMIMPTNLSPNLQKRSLPKASLMLVAVGLWLFGMISFLRWAGAGRWLPDVLFYSFVLAGFIFSGAGFCCVKWAASEKFTAGSASNQPGSKPVRSGRNGSKAGLTGWGLLSAQCIVRQAVLALAAVSIYLLYEAGRAYFFGEVTEIKYGTEQRSIVPSILLASLVTLSYSSMIDGFFSTRLLRTLPLSPFRCGLRLIGLVFGAFLCLFVLAGSAFILFWDDVRSGGWFLYLLGAAGPASLIIPCALYLGDKVSNTPFSGILSGLLVLWVTVVWTHSAPLIGLSSLVLVAPLLGFGGNLVSLWLVARVLSRSSRAYGGHVRAFQ